MCLGGGGGYNYEPPKPPPPPEPGPPSPDDTFNNQAVDNINPRDKQQANRLEDATADQKKKLKIQSDKSDQAY
mgnify:FL=1